MTETIVEDFSSVDPQLRAVIFDGCCDRGLTGDELQAAYYHQLRLALPRPLAEAALANHTNEPAKPVPWMSHDAPPTEPPRAPHTTTAIQERGL